jgi:hydroxymethylpyrimidine pyrophosphatase-like HAD family hydrolase
MNAYKLADELENKDRLWNVDENLMLKNCAMLRQQADRIAELEKDGKVCATCGGLVYDPVLKQTKPLSNEEILDLTIWNKNFYELYVEMEKEDMIAFARAIEKRHGIK